MGIIQTAKKVGYGIGAGVSIAVKVKRILFGIVAVVMFLAMTVGGVYAGWSLTRGCWTCSVFADIYDTISAASFTAFREFQMSALAILSLGLALWMVYTVYQIFIKSFAAFPDGSETEITDRKFFASVYKKMLLSGIVIAVFYLPNPRSIFGWSYELVLSFGSSLSRTVMHRRLAADGIDIPRAVNIGGGRTVDCANLGTPENSSVDPITGLGYKDEKQALSINTRNGLICMIAEIDVMRRDFHNLGTAMFEYGKVHMIIAATTYGVVRIGAKFGGRALVKNGAKRANAARRQSSGGGAGKQPATATEAQQQAGQNARRNAEGNLKRTAWGKRLAASEGFLGALVIVGFMLFDENIRIGLAGLVIMGGFFFLNLLFGFILIEQMLLLGTSLILFPFLAAAYCFEQTREFAAKALTSLRSFAIGLVFLTLMTVLSVELSTWIMGGMLDGRDGSLATVRQATAIIESCNAGGACDIGGFNRLIGTNWLFLYVILAVFISGRLIAEAPKFAGWFDGSLPEAKIGSSLKSFGISYIGYVSSAGRGAATIMRTPAGKVAGGMFGGLKRAGAKVRGLFRRGGS